MPNKTMLTTAFTVVAVIIGWRIVAPKLGLPTV